MIDDSSSSSDDNKDYVRRAQPFYRHGHGKVSSSSSRDVQVLKGASSFIEKCSTEGQSCLRNSDCCGSMTCTIFKAQGTTNLCF